MSHIEEGEDAPGLGIACLGDTAFTQPAQDDAGAQGWVHGAKVLAVEFWTARRHERCHPVLLATEDFGGTENG
jgi:hypothetical protein